MKPSSTTRNPSLSKLSNCSLVHLSVTDFPPCYGHAMVSADLLEAPELAAEHIDARARGENFPVVSLLAPREARPHLRAIYGFARLVDNLGDEAEGDRDI